MLVEKKMRWPLGGIFELPTWFITKEKNFAYGECRKNFNDIVRFLVEHYPNVSFTKYRVSINDCLVKPALEKNFTVPLF
jgi:hypothetical protein